MDSSFTKIIWGIAPIAVTVTTFLVGHFVKGRKGAIIGAVFAIAAIAVFLVFGP